MQNAKKLRENYGALMQSMKKNYPLKALSSQDVRE